MRRSNNFVSPASGADWFLPSARPLRKYSSTVRSPGASRGLWATNQMKRLLFSFSPHISRRYFVKTEKVTAIIQSPTIGLDRVSSFVTRFFFFFQFSITSYSRRCLQTFHVNRIIQKQTIKSRFLTPHDNYNPAVVSMKLCIYIYSFLWHRSSRHVEKQVRWLCTTGYR